MRIAYNAEYEKKTTETKRNMRVYEKAMNTRKGIFNQ